MADNECPGCKGEIGSLPYEFAGRPRTIVCFSHDPPALYCEACDRGEHKPCGKLRRAEEKA